MFPKSNKSERQDEKIAANYTRIVEDLGNRNFLFRLLWVCIIGNLVCWLGVLLFPDFVYAKFSTIFDLSNKLAMSLLGIPFGFGLFAAYCLARLKFSDIEDNKDLDSEMMASFNYQSHSAKRWLVWLFSFLTGVVNCVLLVSVTLFLNDKI